MTFLSITGSPDRFPSFDEDLHVHVHQKNIKEAGRPGTHKTGLTPRGVDRGNSKEYEITMNYNQCACVEGKMR